MRCHGMNSSRINVIIEFIYKRVNGVINNMEDNTMDVSNGK